MNLYFLIGLPTETDDDVLAIAEHLRHVVEIGRRHHKQASCTASVGGFVPQAHTPFQWFGQNPVDLLWHKIDLLKGALRGDRAAQVKWHDPRASFAEGLTSRGDRRLGRVIERVWRGGGRFPGGRAPFSPD